MNNRKDEQRLPHIEEALQTLFTAAEPDAAFISGLEERLLNREAELTGEQTRMAPALQRLWDRVVQSLTGRRWEPVMPTTRLGWTALALVLCLAVGTVAYAALPLLNRVFQMDAGLRQVDQADLVQQLHLSQTVDGVTVTLERAYADANRIVVGYTIKAPNGQRYEARRLTLTDAAGTVFHETVGFGVSGASDILEAAPPPGEKVNVVSFDAAPVEGAPAALDLRLEMELEERALPPGASASPPTPGGLPAEAPMRVEVQPLPVGRIIGPFTFDFRTPFIPGRVIEMNQTVEDAGVAVRLERLVVTPSETRATICFTAPDGGRRQWVPILTLEAGNEQYAGGIVSKTFYEGGEGCYQGSFLASLHDQGGAWRLTVSELVGEDTDLPTEPQIRLAGPWVFRFRVP